MHFWALPLQPPVAHWLQRYIYSIICELREEYYKYISRVVSMRKRGNKEQVARKNEEKLAFFWGENVQFQI